MPYRIQHNQLFLLTIYNITPPMILIQNWGKQLQQKMTIINNFTTIQYKKYNIINK